MKIILLAPAPYNISPSQRFRFEHYIHLESAAKLDFTYSPFYNQKAWSLLHLKDHTIRKSLSIVTGFVKRFFTLFTLYKYDYVYIHREMSPLGPPVFEWITRHVLRKKIIYDFDDAIWIPVASEANPGMAKLKCTWKVKNICGMSTIVTTGNRYLADYAKQFCADVRVIPTVVNTETQHQGKKNQHEGRLTIGWTGTFTNFKYLDKVNPVIRRLKQKYDFEYLIIANKDPGFTGVDYTYKKWDVHTEIADLMQIHIGVMPLENSEIELGKCAFKAIQYMSLGIPPVVSPVGANCVVVHDRATGFWADTDEEWYQTLEKLLNDTLLREQIGLKASKAIEDQYSVNATAHLFLNLFK